MDSIEFENSGYEISIVTISKDDPIGLLKTISSLREQSHTNWKMIIVLSSLQDDSTKIIDDICRNDSRFQVHLAPQPGIYNAMNYGLAKVHSNFVWFMNGGDRFATKDALLLGVRHILKKEIGVLIGGYQFFQNGKLIKFARSPKYISARKFSLNIRSGNHQSMIFSLDKITTKHFDTKYSIASDFKFVLEALRSGKGYRIRDVLADIEPGGISDRMIYEVWEQKQRIRNEIFGHVSLDSLMGLLWTLGAKIKRKAF